MSLCRPLVLAVLVFLVLAGSATESRSATERLVVITSFSDKVSEPIVAAFKQAHPAVSVVVLNRNTAAALSFVREGPSAGVDVFWASALDAFELLKREGSLRPLNWQVADVPTEIAGYPLNDPDGFYLGFALSGYGFMWNPDYLKRHGLKPPRSWADLRDPAYSGHVGITAPSRSGTTHLMVEVELQSVGWEKGWALLLEIAGNLATVTARSYGVMEGVKAGRFGLGPVIDFFGLSSRATGSPVDFAYADNTVMLPANVAILREAPNPLVARQFVAFLLSPEGQSLLFQPDIMRLPVRPEAYAHAPPGYPNPFRDPITRNSPAFDTSLSQFRYNLVNSLFDHVITNRVRGLKKAWQSLHAAEALLAGRDEPQARRQVEEARALLTRVPVSAEDATSVAYAAQFSSRHRGIALPPEQARLEREWTERLAHDLQTAQDLADRALERLGGVATPEGTKP